MCSNESNNAINLRAHHLLCTVLFEGKGYSEEFTNNMTSIVDKLLEKDNYLLLKKERDIICSDCPNLRADGTCMLDGEIPELDKKILDFFELNEDAELSSKIFMKVSEMITPEFFSECCDECRWKKMGICDYEKYVNRIGRFI